MTDIYVRSTDGNNADNGSTWALAKQTLAGAAAIDAAGDNIYLSQNHSESSSVALTIALAGLLNNPTLVVCGNDSAQPPLASSTTAQISTGANASITFSGLAFYVYGVGINCSDGGTNAVVLMLSSSNSAKATYRDCAFRLGSAAAIARIDPTSKTGQVTTFEKCNVSFANPSQRMLVFGTSTFLWLGGSINNDSAAITGLFLGGIGSRALVSGVDLSRGSASMSLFNAGNFSSFGVIRNCRLPVSWSGSLSVNVLSFNERYEMYNCDSSDTNYRLWIADYCGSIKSETTVVRAGGASDGATPLSWAMTSNDNAKSPLLFTLASPEIVRWNDTTGSAITVTIEIVSNEPLDNKQCWIEVQYLGTAGYPLGSLISSAPANLLGLSTALASSSEEWATAGITGPLRQKISVTFTPQERGYVHAVVRLAEPNTTVYVDPLLTIT